MTPTGSLTTLCHSLLIMTDLSPAAQSVLDAFWREARPEPHHQSEAIAAALRAVAYQLGYHIVYDDGEPDYRVDVADLLAIAAELEGQL